MLDRAYIDLTSPIGRGIMAFISAMAEDERLRIIKHTHVEQVGRRPVPLFNLLLRARAIDRGAVDAIDFGIWSAGSKAARSPARTA
jgi:hypothetical protein